MKSIEYMYKNDTVQGYRMFGCPVDKGMYKMGQIKEKYEIDIKRSSDLQEREHEGSDELAGPIPTMASYGNNTTERTSLTERRIE